jgi:hypothetical protein
MAEDAFSQSYSRKQQGAKQHHHFMVYVGWGTTTAVCYYYYTQHQPTNNNKQRSRVSRRWLLFRLIQYAVRSQQSMVLCPCCGDKFLIHVM